MFHDYRMAKAVQEQKLREALRIQEKDPAAEQAETSFREQIVARLVTLLHIRAPEPGAAKSSKSDGLPAI